MHLRASAGVGWAPVFSLFREALPAAQLRRFRGILNSTTNLILTEMETGASFDQAVKKVQDLEIAETDPSRAARGRLVTRRVPRERVVKGSALPYHTRSLDW